MSDDLKARRRDTTLYDGEWESALGLEALARIEELEANLAKAVEALENIARGGAYTDMRIARAALASLQGDKT